MQISSNPLKEKPLPYRKWFFSYIRQKASFIAPQCYLGFAQVVFASRVLEADIIPLKLQVLISLCRKAKYNCETCLTISLKKPCFRRAFFYSFIKISQERSVKPKTLFSFFAKREIAINGWFSSPSATAFE